MLVAKCINNCIMETRVETRLNARHTHTHFYVSNLGLDAEISYIVTINTCQMSQTENEISHGIASSITQSLITLGK
jgi:hypothetical protein